MNDWIILNNNDDGIIRVRYYYDPAGLPSSLELQRYNQDGGVSIALFGAAMEAIKQHLSTPDPAYIYCQCAHPRRWHDGDGGSCGDGCVCEGYQPRNPCRIGGDNQ